MKRIYSLLCLMIASSAICQTSLFPNATSWKYLDNGSDQGTAWIAPAFNDASWASGNAELGYGDGDEATVLSYGADANNKYATSYFRKTFNITDASLYGEVTFSYRRDDGMVVYVNGTEIFRDNMATGVIGFQTFASTTCSDDGNTVYTQTLSLANSKLLTGSNTIAIEIHQSVGTSSDISFIMQLTAESVPSEVFPYATSWKYLDNGSDQGTTWTTSAFNDALWASGNAELGYGDGDEATVVSYGSNSSNKYPTTYFRKTLNIADVSQFSQFTFSYRRDDGMILYVNGMELFRDNMPTGTIGYQTFASTACSDDGNTVYTQTVTLANSQLVSGNNTIAVEIHQSSGNSSDISFVLKLEGTPVPPPAAAILTRGPYLQKGTSSSMTFRWLTDQAVDSKVMYGTDVAALSQSEVLAGAVTDHTITITGLLPYTKYFYSVGSSTEGMLQGDADNYFVTSPTIGAEGNYKFWVIGDCGNNSTNQKNVLDQYNTYIGADTTNGWLTMGDNAYNAGLDTEFGTNFFDIYEGSIMKHAPMWPVPGNHDYANDANRQNDHNVPYFTIFETPSNGEAGGVASLTEAYYSYDYGNVHFLALDSYGNENNATRLYDTSGAQATWIKQDLSANTQKWIVAYWHHPPYTMGSHNSDTEGELISMRQNFIKILERYGVDLILCGHSHDYERSRLMKGHYGNEASFDPAVHNLSQSSGVYDGSSNSCTYLKDEAHTLDGTIYVVSGSSGQLGGTQSTFPHDAMYYSNATNGGSLVLNVQGSRLDVKWLCADGLIRDKFTVIKDASKVQNITINAGDDLNLKASWKGDYIWSHSAEQTRMVNVAPTINTTYVVNDVYECVADTFKVTVVQIATDVTASQNTSAVNIYPNPFQDELTIRYNMPSAGTATIEIIDLSGRVVQTPLKNQYLSAGDQQWTLNALQQGLTEGMYFISITTDQHKELLRVMRTK
ncbi:MAG: hypothetical protein JWO58_841 [Chitinophagaceae bacterium]|nr:hypothetical protein [Chitinophagaceae bacterium]